MAPAASVGATASSTARSRLTMRVAAETAAVLVAVALAVLMTAHLAGSPRGWLLFYDGDSVFPALVRGSLATGQAQDWALSPVLFLPELGVYLALGLLGLSVKAAFVVNAVINFTALFLALRMVAGMALPDRPRWMRIGGPLLAMGCVTVLVLTESSADRNGFELASLLATTTYYSATVIGMIVTVGLVARLVTGRRRSPWAPAVLLLVISAASVLTNPIFIAWSCVPVAMVLVTAAILRVADPRRVGWPLGAMAIGILLGFLGRIPFSRVITADATSYSQPGRAGPSLEYYGTMLLDRIGTVVGLLAVALVVASIVAGALLCRSMARRHRPAAAVVAGIGCVTPIVVGIGAVLLGTEATRYLAPVFFAPLVGVCLLPARLPTGTVRRKASGWRAWRRLPTIVAGVLAAALIAGAGAAVPRLATDALTLDPDVRCVDTWIAASGRTGVGQFWTIRAPKAYLANPAQLIQTTDTLAPYPWLVNRADYANLGRASFVLTSAQDPPLAPATMRGLHVARTVTCGRYTIMVEGR